MVSESQSQLITTFTAHLLQPFFNFKLNRGMSRPAVEFYIRVSIFWTLLSLAECGECPLNIGHKPVGYDARISFKGNHNVSQNSYGSYFGWDCASGHQKIVPVREDICSRCQLFPFHSSVYGFHSEGQCSRLRNLDGNNCGSGAALPEQSSGQAGTTSSSSDHLTFRLADGGFVRCSLNIRELGHEMSPPSVHNADQIVFSSCRAHLLYQKDTSFSSKNLEIEKSPSSDSFSSPHVNISPSKLDWGQQNYLYHPSVAFLSLKNTCNESLLKVYEPFSTDTQFYPFNFSEVVLGPGEMTPISFVFLPKWLGLSSAELVLQTSFGGFMIEARGFAVESPHRSRPLVGLDVSSAGWLSRKLSLSNPFNETIHLEEVSAWVSVSESHGPLLAEAICSKWHPQDSDDYSEKVSNDKSGEFNSVVMSVRPLSNWVISPHRTESILEMTFSPDSGQVVGAICMQMLRPLENEKDTLVVPFEAELNKISTWKDRVGQLSVSIEAVGSCSGGETVISVSVTNSASHLLKIVRISEVVDSKKLLQIKYFDGLLLFPGAVTQVALVTYESSNVIYDSFLKIADVSMSCKLQILTNDSVSPLLEVPCREIFGICPRQQQELLTHQPDTVEFSNRRTGSLTSRERSQALIKALGDVEADDDAYVLQNWRGQSTMSGLYVLDDPELLFPIVQIGRHHAKSITVNNPSQQPVLVQLILNTGEIIENCKTHYNHLHPPSSSSYIHNDSTRLSGNGFSILDSAVTEAYLHPHGTASLGPIFFYPSDRCEWKSSAVIRSNLSGVERLSLRGFGGSLSLVLLEGSELVHRLEFETTPNVVNASSSCRKPLSKNLIALNTGDFPFSVKNIHVSGRECGLDGFLVRNCKGFALEPGESMELGISYQTDYSMPVVQRDLELILVGGILVIPMKASIPLQVFNFCKNSIFWVRVKKCCIAVVLAAILISLLFWLPTPQTMPSVSVDFLIKGEKSSTNEAADSSLEGQNKIISLSPASDEIRETGLSTASQPLKPATVERDGKLEVAQPEVNLTVKTHNKRKRPRRRRGGGGSGLVNSTPSSPRSPANSLSPEGTCSPSPGKRQPYSSPATPMIDRGNCGDNLFFTQQPPSPDLRKTEDRAMLSPSAATIAPHARAPGSKLHAQKEAVQVDEQVRQEEEDRFTYDIWGNHFEGLHQMNRPNDDPSSVRSLSAVEGNSDSFFVRGPQQTFMTNSPPRSVSSSTDQQGFDK